VAHIAVFICHEDGRHQQLETRNQ